MTFEELQANKDLYRALKKAKFRLMPKTSLKSGSEQIVERLLALPEFAAAETVMLYWPMAHLGEVDIRPVISAALKQKKVVCLPRVNWAKHKMVPAAIRTLKDLVKDEAHPHLKLRQPSDDAPPVPAAAIDLVLVPGLAFDRAGNRLGRGGGFYDRFLAGLGGRTIRAAAAFSLDDALPAMAHDEPVDMVVTPTEVVRVRRAAGKR